MWPLVTELAASDPRIVARRREQNGGIVAASNDAIAMATGDVVALLDHDDLLHPTALREVADVFVHEPDVDYVYIDNMPAVHFKNQGPLSCTPVAWPPLTLPHRVLV